MYNVMTIVGTRPELIKLSRLIPLLDKFCNHTLVHTGQNYDYELNQIFFQDLDIRQPDYFLNAVGENAAQTIANVISESDALFRKLMPDALLVYGDTNSCLAVISAKRHKIPIFHMEAGNRSFDQRVPEELNRKVVDHLSDINFVLTEHARKYLLDEGIRGETIVKTGSHMKEVIDAYSDKIAKSDILSQLNLSKGDYFVVSAHREENVDNEIILRSMIDSFNLLAEKYNIPVIVSTHPRTRNRIESLKHSGLSEKVRYLKPFGFSDYIALQINARCVISDSGTIFEESALLGFPAITLRKAHERPEATDAGILIMADINPQSIVNAIDVTLNNPYRNSPPKVPDYEIGNSAETILKTVLSYIPYVNRTVWKKTT